MQREQRAMLVLDGGVPLIDERTEEQLPLLLLLADEESLLLLPWIGIGAGRDVCAAVVWS